ncbi:uncharacterized protein [Watersipora subatra]|uniref:uncharacterized protein n=1 Tax=Watersipora subatra TaxID=2589382 RepID=UPI00355C8C5B
MCTLYSMCTQYSVFNLPNQKTNDGYFWSASEPTINGFISGVDNYYSSPPGNAMANNPMFDRVPTAGMTICSRPETIDEQPLENNPEMPTIQFPSEELNCNEEPDYFQPGIQVTIGGPSDTLGHNRELRVLDTVPPVPSTTTYPGKLIRNVFTSLMSNSQEEGANDCHGHAFIEDEMGKRVMKRAHPISGDDLDIVLAPPKKPYDRADACHCEWNTGNFEARTSNTGVDISGKHDLSSGFSSDEGTGPYRVDDEVEFEKQPMPLFDLNDNLPYYN